jgi:hypothetical protein
LKLDIDINIIWLYDKSNLEEIMVGFRYFACFFVFVFFGMTLNAQTAVSEPSQSPTVQYRLFRTNNMWTFIKLDTITGKMWQLQFDIQGDERGSLELNIRDLAAGKQRIPGRFTLYPTTNMYTFILVDQIDGNTWQIQWSIERVNRLILPID